MSACNRCDEPKKGKKPSRRDVSPETCQTTNGKWLQRPALAYYANSVPAASCVYVTEETDTMAAATPSEELMITWERPGVVVGIVASVTIRGTFATREDARAGVGVSVLTGASRENLMTDGMAEQFLPVDALAGSELSRVFPLGLRVSAKDVWRVKFSSRLEGAQARAAFWFREDIGERQAEPT